ncbi:Ankyrin [Plasmopara halstedii]|uniref:Ankyrin n=1 Tax=Plasmopara halstedii TaxID=4781 RepID=A0A0P1AQ62_PLAHL|nr:Ankyrin [Plasmopara halstedii]CEG43249.1 Ankyrin [Plasmopara halstedii]|eukprot:XP_024579618.1 Ankyrin [Plasmopara halstedii]
MASPTTLHAQLLHARDEIQQARDKLSQMSARGFHDAFMEPLRCPYEAAARTYNNCNHVKTTIWPRLDLLEFLSIYFPQYAQQPTAFSVLCASLTRTSSDSESAENEDANEFVPVTFDTLKSVLVRQFVSTRLVAKDPFPLEPRVELKPECHPNTVPYRPKSTNVKENLPNEATFTPMFHEFQWKVMKRSKSWLGRWRARHLVLRWGILEIHKRSPTVRSFRQHSSNVSFNTSFSTIVRNSSIPLISSGDIAPKMKCYDLENLVSIKLEHVSDDDATPTRKAALTLTFQKPVYSNSSNLSSTVTQDIKTLVIGNGETSEMLVSIRDHIATFALYLELSRRDRLPKLKKIRQLIAANAMANLRLRISRLLSPDDSRQQEIQEKQSPSGSVTALQLAFLQDPRVPSFESTIAVLLNSDADPRALLHWDYATQVVFSRSFSGSSEQKVDQQQRQRLRKRLLLLDKVDSEGEESANFHCYQVQADDANRWNLLMYLSWMGDVEGVHQLLSIAGLQRTSTNTSRTSNYQGATCLDHVNATGDTALHIAIKSSNEEVALALIEAILFINAQVVHQCDGCGEPVVHLALKQQQWRVVDALVAGHAVDPRSYDALGMSALHLAILLRAPVALIARLIQLYRHISPTEGLDRQVSRRESNDTPLSLALKNGQQQVVALLLDFGASPVTLICQWSEASIESKRDARRKGYREEKVVFGNDDKALHIAIKSGQEVAAAALIAHKADINTLDSRGASSLALAIRHGLYALAAVLIEQHQKEEKKEKVYTINRNWWIDQDTKTPVVGLACQAGQIELAAFLLDRMSQDQTCQSQSYPVQLLPLLVQMSSKIGRRDEGKTTSMGDNTSVSRRLSGGILDFEMKRSNCLKKTRASSFDSVWANDDSRHRQNTFSVSTSYLYDNNSKTTTFLFQGIEAVVVRILQFSETISILQVLGGNESVKATDSSQFKIPSVVQSIKTLPSISPIHCDELITTSPLHVAASGGVSTYNLLRILLAFLSISDPYAAAQVLMHSIGTRAETPLHAALAEGAASNALLLLYLSRELQARNAEIQLLCAKLLTMTTRTGNTALHLACMWPHQTSMLLVVELLLQEHVESANWNHSGFAPLHVALRKQCDETLIELFVQYGQDLNLWTEGKPCRDNQNGNFREFILNPATTLISACPHNPLMLAVEFQCASAFRALVSGGAHTRASMPHARIGLLQLAVHLSVRDPQLVACLVDNLDLIRSAQSDVVDQWGVSPREARLKLIQIWREERSSLNDKNTEHHISFVSPLGDIGNSELACRKVSSAPTHPNVPSPLSITTISPRIDAMPLATPQNLRATPQSPKLSATTLKILREEELATLTLVAREARTEALDWLAKRIGQKKLLSDAHAQLQNVNKHRRTASGSSSASNSKDEVDALYMHTSGILIQSDQQLLEELKAGAAKMFIDKHVAEAVSEARLSIEREKTSIFQETGYYPGLLSHNKKHKNDDGKYRSLLGQAVCSTTEMILLASSSASATSVSSEDSNSMHFSDESYGTEFWWAERGPAYLSDESSFSWLAISNPRDITMLGDPVASTSQLSRTPNERGVFLDEGIDGRLALASISLYDSAEASRYHDKI